MQKRFAEEKAEVQKNKKENIESKIGRILFREELFTPETAERYVFPFEQSGYLSAEQKLELLLYETEKRRRKGEDVCLLTELGRKKTVITEETVTELYLKWRRECRCFFSWEEKRVILVRRLASRIWAGGLGILLRIGGDAIEIGTYVTTKNKEENIGVRKGDKTFRFPFLSVSSEEETERIVRNLISRELHGEITVQNPLWCHERPDGTRLYATRPPASPHWGMKIIFGNERRAEWDDRENRFCGL